MARRRTKAKAKRSRKPAFNLMNAAQTYLNTAIITRAAFRVTPIEFFTGTTADTVTENWKTNPSGGRYLAGTTTTSGYQPIANGTQLTLLEILGRDSPSGAVVPFGGHGVFMDNVKENIKLNGGLINPIIQTVGVNVGFAVAKKLLSKQRRVVNKGLKMAGLRKDVMV